MNVSELFIKRPVMTSLVMAAFLFAGLFGYFALPVNELPNVDFPTIVVNASLPGADAETMASTVATPLETQFSLIAGLDTMSSTNVLGATQITLQFRLDRNIDAAAQDVQSAMAAAARQLPLNLPAPPTMRKVNPAESSIFQITVTSPSLPLSAVDEYAETIIVRSISSIDGVANVDIFGQAHPAVRIQLDPDALAVRGIGVDQVAGCGEERQRQSRDRSARRAVAFGHHPDCRASSPRPPTIVRRSSPIRAARPCASATSRTSSTASRTRGFRAPITASPASRSPSTGSRAPTRSRW